MSNIWLTSDWHFCHSQPFIYEPRGFKNQYEMNQTIIKNYNSVVQPNDDVYCVGDCILNDNEEGIKCIKQLKGKIHIIRGNHDTDKRMELYKNCYNVVEVCDAKFLNIEKQNFFLTHYPCLTSNFDENKPLNRRTINICGHAHTKDKFLDFNKGLIYHVECDAHNCYPILLENILTDIRKELNK